MAITNIGTTREIWMVLTDRTKLARLMILQEVSQRDLAKAVGWKSHTYVGRILSGDVKTVTPEVAVRIAHHLGCVIDDLFTPRMSNDERRNVKPSKTRTQVAA